MHYSLQSSVSSEKPTIDVILERLQVLPFADRVLVFGSTGKGKPNPVDVDACVDFGALTRKQYLEADPGGKQLDVLLQIAREFYGSFDPFLRFAGGDLLVRDDDARKWVRARNAAELISAIDEDGLTLPQVMATRKALVAMIVERESPSLALRVR